MAEHSEPTERGVHAEKASAFRVVKGASGVSLVLAIVLGFLSLVLFTFAQVLPALIVLALACVLFWAGRRGVHQSVRYEQDHGARTEDQHS